MVSNFMKNSKFKSLFLILIFCIANYSLFAKPPKIKIVSVNRIYDNGEHNAFTDMCRYNEYIYLAFRSCPDGHAVNPTSSIIVLRSKFGKKWEEVNRFDVQYRDTRDPHFLTFNDKLFLYTGTWYYGDPNNGRNKFNINEHLGYAVWTEDGTDWHEPTLLEGTYGHYIWRAAAFDGKAYLCGRRKQEFADLFPDNNGERIIESAMLESEDGLIWKKKSLFQEKNGDETAFLFEADGTILAVARRGRNNAELCSSELPWKEWTRHDLGEYIGGPMLVKWGKHYLVGGRKKTDDGNRTVLSWLIGNDLFQFAEFPSGGDNSYPGFIELSPNRALVSYYSSHEKYENGETITAIYLAEIQIDEE